MWPFRTAAPKTELYVEPGLLKRLIEIEARQVTLERSVKTIDAEWSEWFDKFRHMYARLAKRIKDAAEVDGNGAQSLEDAPGRAIEPPPSPGHSGVFPHRYPAPGARRNY